MPDTLSQDQVASELADLGVIPGDVIMVHASLRRVGPVEGEAVGLLDSIRGAVGPIGTVVMIIAADDDQPFDHRTTPADPEIGALAEVFRTLPDVKVNDHPACRFAAVGPVAAHILTPQPLHDYYGPGSPLERLYNLGVKVLRLGSDIDTVTLTHLAEYRAEVPKKRTVTRKYHRADYGEVAIDSLDDSDGIVEWSGGDYFGQILVDFVADDHAKVGRVGGCEAELLDGRQFVDFAVDWMERELA